MTPHPRCPAPSDADGECCGRATADRAEPYRPRHRPRPRRHAAVAATAASPSAAWRSCHAAPMAAASHDGGRRPCSGRHRATGPPSCGRAADCCPDSARAVRVPSPYESHVAKRPCASRPCARRPPPWQSRTCAQPCLSARNFRLGSPFSAIAACSIQNRIRDQEFCGKVCKMKRRPKHAEDETCAQTKIPCRKLDSRDLGRPQTGRAHRRTLPHPRRLSQRP